MSEWSYEKWAEKVANRRKTKRQVYLEDCGVEMPWAPLPSDFPPGPPGCCYSNCAKWVFRRKTLRYVEGMALLTNCSDETYRWQNVIWRPDLGRFARFVCHAWLLDKHGNVIDPTWDYPLWCPERCYKGIVIPTPDLKRLVDRTGFYMGFIPKYWRLPKKE